MGYRIEYKQCADERCLFGVSTMEKMVWIFNLSPEKPEDWKQIESLLWQADVQYCNEWKR